MLTYAPAQLPAKAPLVVVLHGCTQTAEGYEANAGWTRLADEAGFAVLYPEQRRANNAQGCFNWFQASDTARGLGETRSIRAMIEAMITRHDIDRSRVFVTGLSAGGAMTAALPADYPEVFAGGAVIAGLPCGAALSLPQALDAMNRPRPKSPEQLGDAVRAASGERGPWPVVSVWHGQADSVVVPQNADELVKQWTNVHGVPLEDFREEIDGVVRRRVWSSGGRDVVELNLIAGLAHGAPLDSRLGERPGPFMLDAAVSSTRRIAAFWRIDRPAAGRSASRPASDPRGAVPMAATGAKASRDGAAAARTPPPAAEARPRPRKEPKPSHQARADLSGVISRALRAAGLMR